MISKQDRLNEELICAVVIGRADLARKALEKGADVNYQDITGTTPLMVAAYNGKIELVHLLISSGADTTLKDCEGVTAADSAEENGHDCIASILRPSEKRLKLLKTLVAYKC